MNIYTRILRPLLFSLDAERAHHLVLRQLSILPPFFVRMIFGRLPRYPAQQLFGVAFPSRVGLAAGMDKNGIALRGWEALGFGFVEIGTITARPQPGNARPRLFRYPEQAALVNRMGFNNDGAEAIAARLDRLRKTGKWPAIPVGINLGKSKSTPLDEASADYLSSLRALRSFGDYFVINVSSPNTPGLRELQETYRLSEIVHNLRSEDPHARLLVKISPDVSDQQALEIAKLTEDQKLAGLIATNTTLDHAALPSDRDQQGGLSGAPLRARATHLLQMLSSQSALPLIASGGVMDAASAKEKFDAGAHLVQIYTGLVYRGPQLIREIAALDSELSPANPLNV
jgi:dihydroorotate dehydrogenase